ncbi:MAG: PEP/pyruvate-binding domain-containing protein [Verrucomicrobiales bacterium]
MNASQCLGGKGSALEVLGRAGMPVPRWFAVPPGGELDAGRLAGLKELTGERFAVRSSAVGEDGALSSYAGQLESYLWVSRDDVAGKIGAVRESAGAARVAVYQGERGEGAEVLETAVIVQEMVDARAAGVAFSADPVTGQRRVVMVSAVEGTAEKLVSGEVDGETWRWEREWVERGGVLSEEEAGKVRDLALACERVFGVPQDIEWAVDRDGELWLLQSRAITTLGKAADPDDEMRIWDNSNIAESYSGVTTALTFSFARRIYEHVYREFCHLMKVPERRIERADDVFPQMLGMIEGRVYYNLLSWYRVLALLPGFSVNRKFMEQMMGVKESLPVEWTERIAAENKESGWRDGLAMAGMLVGWVVNQATLKRQCAEFRERFDAAMAPPPVPLERMSGDELVAHYRDLEGRLLKRWDAPLVNDFLAMVWHGVLRKLCGKWAGDEELASGLLMDCGEIISAEPPRRIREMAGMAAEVDGLGALLADGEVRREEKLEALKKRKDLAREFDRYLEDFGDRCMEELKLESPTLMDDPDSLLLSIGAMAVRGAAGDGVGEVPEVPEVPGLGGLKRVVFMRVLRMTRERIRDRENLRFERTRLFGRVRRIVRELGRRLCADGVLDEEADVFHLEVGELLEIWEGTRSMGVARELAAVRRREYERCLESPAPPDRVEARGPWHRQRVEDLAEAKVVGGSGGLKGVGACAGVVTGKVRVVEDPRAVRVEAGEILVARQTDPGWVVLFPSAAGLLVERGSVLSHSAIVSRELGLPCVVSLTGVMDRLQTGDVVTMDGKTGEVTICNE